MWEVKMEAAGIYDFDYALQRWAMDPLTHLNVNEKWVDIPVQMKNDSCVVRVTSIGTTEHPWFRIEGNSQKNKESLLAHVVHLFQWERSLEKVQEHFAHTNLGDLFALYPGTPIVKDFNLYDCLMKVIIHQQLNMKFAYTLSTRFVEQFGYKRDDVWFYPNPEVVASLDYGQLRELQFSQRKAEYIIDTSRLIAEGSLNLEELSKRPNEEVMAELVQIRGVGPWTAENWLMFGAGRGNLFPKADIGIQKALQRYFKSDKRPDFEQMNELSAEWGPFKSYASLTLWRSIEG
ncbi:DNA-3-methyladenine glycosylase family protein [Halobacillus naozhouensis]|uniref:DNA-3-methyladenine glycosylase II n=1 Tax=Halobacillus naozhouensis TaxID=554880 RepID=A0ABY8J003_9BACI|nr:DNA-3-methyladenine glycosylase [Halobacillus naozhouensis]WFT75824.1 DNA-3-methyladenine glycosylase [Halobacillus naozhouensis]